MEAQRTDACHDHPTDHAGCGRCVGRRTALMGVGAVAAAGLLAACGDDDGSTAGGGREGTVRGSGSGTPSASDEPSASDPPDDEAGAEAGDPEALATTSEIPVGGGVVVDAHGVVVVQPAAGEFLAFSSTCTHQGCSVTSVADGLITCPCHGSRFSAADGSVQSGPATAPLPEVTITVDGDAIRHG